MGDQVEDGVAFAGQFGQMPEIVFNAQGLAVMPTGRLVFQEPGPPGGNGFPLGSLGQAEGVSRIGDRHAALLRWAHGLLNGSRVMPGGC